MLFASDMRVGVRQQALLLCKSSSTEETFVLCESDVK